MRDTFHPTPLPATFRARVAGHSSLHTLSWVNASLLQGRMLVPHRSAALALYRVTLVAKHDTSAPSHTELEAQRAGGRVRGRAGDLGSAVLQLCDLGGVFPPR